MQLAKSSKVDAEITFLTLFDDTNKRKFYEK
jgi:hypothetical protein